MKLTDFVIGEKFQCGGNTWLCTDIGTRVAIGIKLSSVNAVITDFNKKVVRIELTEEQARKDGWFNGPPYAVGESVFDEYDMEGCEKQ